MTKKILAISCFLLYSCLVHAQNSPDKNHRADAGDAAISNNKVWKEFVSVALTPPRGEQLSLVRKWQLPIFYKIYGSSGNIDNDKKIIEYIAQLVQKLAPLTGLDISSTEDDAQANLYLVISRPEGFSQITLPQAAPSFDTDITDSHCYSSVGDSYVRMLTYINPGDTTLIRHKHSEQMNNMVERINAAAAPGANMGNANVILMDSRSTGQSMRVITPKSNHQNNSDRLQMLWCNVRLMLMKSLGFNGIVDDSSSLFTNYFSERLVSQKIISSDARIIKALYNPAVKPGMTGQEVYTVAGADFLK